MANNGGGKGNFAGTGGYSSGSTMAGNAGGYGNPSSPTGGTGGQTQNSYNSGNWGGGFSGMGYANDAANKAALNAALSRAMDKGAGGALMNQVSAPKPMPKPVPPQIIQNPIAPLPPSVQPPVPGEVDPRIPSLWEGYNPLSSIGTTAGYNAFGLGRPTPPQSSYSRPIDYGGSVQPGWSPGQGYPGRPGADGTVRGLANGGFAAPGETVMVGERGPEYMQAGMGGAAVQPMMNTMGAGGGPLNFNSLIQSLMAQGMAGGSGSQMTVPQGSLSGISPNDVSSGFSGLMNAITNRQRQMGSGPHQYNSGGKGNFGGMGRPTGGGNLGNLAGSGSVPGGLPGNWNHKGGIDGSGPSGYGFGSSWS